MEVVSKITLLFAAFGAIAGCIFAPLVVYVNFPGGLPGFFAGLALFFAIFFIPYKVAPIALKIRPAEFPDGKWTIESAIKKGFISFFIIWLIMWIMVYTILLS